MEQVQAEPPRTFNQVHALSQELSSVKTKVEFLNTDRVNKDKIVDELRQANRQLVNMIPSGSGGGGGGDRNGDSNLIDINAMNPTVFDSKPGSSFEAWAKKVRAYCNASRPSFLSVFKWVEG